MIALDAPTAALLASSALNVAALIELDFTAPIGTQRYTSWSSDLQYDGNTYRGIGHILAVPTVKSSAEASQDTHTLAISSADMSVIALALGPASSYVGKRARLYTVFLTMEGVPVGGKRLYFTGHMEPVSIAEESGDGGTSTGRIELPLRRLGMARSRNAEGIRMTHQQQQIDYPGDMGLSGMDKMLESQVWHSKEFQRANA